MILLAPLSCGRPLPDLDDAHRDLTDALPVFPGAEGFGTDTPAGRGGEILIVDSLAAAGPGSLRAALEASGPRVVVFEVGGVIHLTEHIRVHEPFVTVAGQTAPSPGITLSGAGLEISTHDVLIQHLRVRPGDAVEGPKPKNRDSISVVGTSDGNTDVFGVVIDHCSLSWAIDEIGSTNYQGVHDVTWSNTLFTEGLWNSLHNEQPHSMGLLIGSHSRRIAVIRNVFAHNHDRNPVVSKDVSALVANNFVYDPGQFAIVMYNGRSCCPSLATIENNSVVFGVASDEGMPAVHITTKVHKDSRVFVTDSGEIEDQRGVLVDERPVTVSPLTLVPAAELEPLLLDSAGAWPADRDEVDARVIAEIRAREGGPIDSPSEVGGQPDTGPTSQTAMIPADPNGDDDADGYTNLEEWLHELAWDAEGS